MYSEIVVREMSLEMPIRECVVPDCLKEKWCAVDAVRQTMLRMRKYLHWRQHHKSRPRASSLSRTPHHAARLSDQSTLSRSVPSLSPPGRLNRRRPLSSGRHTHERPLSWVSYLHLRHTGEGAFDMRRDLARESGVFENDPFPLPEDVVRTWTQRNAATTASPASVANNREFLEDAGLLALCREAAVAKTYRQRFISSSVDSPQQKSDDSFDDSQTPPDDQALCNLVAPATLFGTRIRFALAPNRKVRIASTIIFRGYTRA